LEKLCIAGTAKTSANKANEETELQSAIDQSMKENFCSGNRH